MQPRIKLALNLHEDIEKALEEDIITSFGFLGGDETLRVRSAGLTGNIIAQCFTNWISFNAIRKLALAVLKSLRKHLFFFYYCSVPLILIFKPNIL